MSVAVRVCVYMCQHVWVQLNGVICIPQKVDVSPTFKCADHELLLITYNAYTYC